MLDTLELYQDKGTDYVVSCKSKGVFNYTLKQLYNSFLHSIEFSEY